MRLVATLALALFAAGCERFQNDEQKALSDARDVARVEAAQNVAPKINLLAPQPITFADITRYKLFGASCALRPDEAGDQVVALAMADAAYIKIAGELRAFVADRGSASLPLGSWTRYLGREHVIDLQVSEAEGKRSGEETTDWRGWLTIRDPYDRVVYSAPGTVQCGA
jgi:hypothetical protein